MFFLSFTLHQPEIHLFVLFQSSVQIGMKILLNSSSDPKEMIRMLLVSDSSLFYALLVWRVFLGLACT